MKTRKTRASDRARFAGIRHRKGVLTPPRRPVGIIVSDFNAFYTAKLLDGALETLLGAGVRRSRIEVTHVPGSFEIPLVVKRMLKRRRYGAIIALGVILKGETRHFEHVADAASRGILKASLESDVPVINAVIPAENERQAAARTGGRLGHRGRDAARSALRMANLLERN